MNASCILESIHAGLTEDRPPPHAWKLSSGADLRRSPTLRHQWENLLARRPGPQAVYQSPAWLEHLNSVGAGRWTAVAAKWNQSGTLQAAVPLCGREDALPFRLCGRTLWRVRLRAVHVLGSEPPVGQDSNLLKECFSIIRDAFPDYPCVRLPTLPTRGFAWRSFQEATFIRENYLAHVAEPPREYHLVSLPPTLPEFLDALPADERRRLRRRPGGATKAAAEIEPIATASEVPTLVQALAALSRGVPCEAQRRLTDQAERGLLRAYILKKGGEVAACLVGLQVGESISFVNSLSGTYRAAHGQEVSPLALVVEDLLRHTPARRVSLGPGLRCPWPSLCEPHSCVNLILFPRTVWSTVCRGAHAGLQFISRALRTAPPTGGACGLSEASYGLA
jgi:hypothetical protein